MEIPGKFQPGDRNSITDVPGVTAAHVTIKEACINTGVTIISPCNGDVFTNQLPAAVAVGNGFGKLAGALQIEEMGALESLIGLTNTLSVAALMQGLVNYHAPKLPEDYNSINVLVGETNDCRLNDIKGFHIRPEHVTQAISLLSKDIEEGDVGAGTGTVCFGFKGGIGTSSRVISVEDEDFTVGALVQSNYGGRLKIYGQTVPKLPKSNEILQAQPENGSCMIVLLTDAPLSSRQLKRLAKRGLIGMTETGSIMQNGSGDFCVAASNFEKNRRNIYSKAGQYYYLNDSQLNPFFIAAVEAVQEALYNSMTMAKGAGRGDYFYPGLNLADYKDILHLKDLEV